MFASEIVSKPPSNPKESTLISHFLMVKIYMKIICKTHILIFYGYIKHTFKNDHKSSKPRIFSPFFVGKISMPPQVPSPPPAVDKAEGSHGNGAWNPGATWETHGIMGYPLVN